MEFVTIHHLSREMNISERIIRYRLLNLIAEGKFKENEDFRRDEFKDDLHFVWKIHPLRFMAETGLKQVTASSLPTDKDLAHKAPPVGNETVNTPRPVFAEPPRPGPSSFELTRLLD